LKKVVIKLSGSVFDNVIENLNSLSKLIHKLYNEGYKIILVTGGGKEARKFIEIGRALGMDEAGLDEVGIEVSRLNARLVIASLGDLGYPYVPRSLDEVIKAFVTDRVVVLGGLYPGQSTNAVAAIVAEKLHADVYLNTTDVEGVYDKDPRTHPDAKLIKRITIKELENLLRVYSVKAGTYELLDPIALRIIERSKIRCLVMKYDTELIEKAIKGEIVGTLVEVNA
jgi:uridylate kinase